MMRLQTAVYLIITLVKGLECLKITELVVPRHANVATSVTLVCTFDLERAKLYSVKWYKDDLEFYRFMPEHHPQRQIFPQEALNINEVMSDLNRVTLSQIEYGASGVYKCEVSTEAPTFEAAVLNCSMEVLSFPDGEPIITGVASSYAIGDYITGNCTSAKSKPAPLIFWFINGVKADSWLLDKYEVIKHPGPLYSRSLGLRFQVEKRHFQGRGQTVVLKCQVEVSDLKPQVRMVSPYLSTSSMSNTDKIHQRLRNSAGVLIVKDREIVFFIFCCLAAILAS